MNPDAYVLSKVDWHYFGTLTYASVKPQYVRRSMTMALMYRIARMLSVRPNRLLWVLRDEAGELNEREHHHFLIRLDDIRSTSKRTCFALDALWKKVGGGITDIRPYNQQLAGADYVTKCLSGANEYELKKFNGSLNRLMLSHRLEKELKRIADDSHVRSHRDEVKDGTRQRTGN